MTSEMMATPEGSHYGTPLEVCGRCGGKGWTRSELACRECQGTGVAPSSPRAAPSPATLTTEVRVPSYPSGAYRYVKTAHGWQVRDPLDDHHMGSLVGYGHSNPTWLMARLAEALEHLHALASRPSPVPGARDAAAAPSLATPTGATSDE